MSIYITAGLRRKLYEARVDMGLTQGELRSIANVSESYISLLERGLRRWCSPETLEAIAQALDINIDSYLRKEVWFESKFRDMQGRIKGLPVKCEVDIANSSSVRDWFSEDRKSVV